MFLIKMVGKYRDIVQGSLHEHEANKTKCICCINKESCMHEYYYPQKMALIARIAASEPAYV